MANRNNVSNDRGQPGRNRPPRARDVRRMSQFRENYAIQHGDWSGSVDQHELGMERLAIARQAPNRRNGPPRRSQGLPAPSVTSTPPNDEVMYEGSGSGSSPYEFTASHNLDYAGFLPVLESTYKLYCDQNPMFPRSTPYCVWQHAYTELLNASILHQAKKECDPAMAFLEDPMLAAPFEDMNVPLPIHRYIEGATKVMSPAGELVYVNRPIASIPNARIPADNGVPALDSGSFGPLNEETHNAYECYVSPYITKRLIERTLEINSTPPGGNQQERIAFRTRFDDWSPFAVGNRPATGHFNRNLLGYRTPEECKSEAVSMLRECHFVNDDTILGRLCHSSEVICRVSAAVAREKRIKHHKAKFKYTSTMATLCYKVTRNLPASPHRIADVQGHVR